MEVNRWLGVVVMVVVVVVLVVCENQAPPEKGRDDGRW